MICSYRRGQQVGLAGGLRMLPTLDEGGRASGTSAPPAETRASLRISASRVASTWLSSVNTDPNTLKLPVILKCARAFYRTAPGGGG